MKYRKLDSNGDYTMGRKSNTLISDTDAVAQAVYTRLKLWEGEWWEAQEEGLPMLQRILGFSNSKQAADILIKDRIATTLDITGVISFSSEFNPNDRSYSCVVEVTTTYGIITLQEGIL